MWLLCITIIFSQRSAYSQTVQIGQKCPDVTLYNVMNYPHNKIRLSDFKGKLIILDFWGLHCTACIAAFPEMDSLQKIFGNKIQIIMVNKEDEDSTKHFFTKMKNIKMPSLPFVTGDTILSKFFPYLLVPQHVWIDDSGTVRYITNGWNTTAAHIREFLNGKDIKLPLKKDILNFSWDEPFITIPDNNIQNKIEYYSYMMHAIKGLSGSYGLDSKDGSLIPNHIQFNRVEAINLFAKAFGEGGKYDFNPRNSIVLEVKDTAMFVAPKNIDAFNKWSEKYSYCYELMVPPSKASLLYKFMQQDLERYFGVKARIEKRKVRCIVIVRTGKKNKIKTKGGKSETYQKDQQWYFQNVSINDFILELRVIADNKPCPEPIIDNTDYKGNVDIAMDASLIKNFNIATLRKSLQKFGLDVKEEIWPTTVLVIKEKK
jgi:thiol-disulfide isomerase/thioredoxin